MVQADVLRDRWSRVRFLRTFYRIGEAGARSFHYQ